MSSPPIASATAGWLPIPSQQYNPSNQFLRLPTHRVHPKAGLNPPKMWQRVVEAYLVNKLIRSPIFHRGVGWVHKRAWELRNGKSMEDMGGTKLDGPGEGFASQFVKEIKLQLKGRPSK